MNDLMNLIDDVKDSIGDGKYLELCNAMKNLYTSNETTTTTPTTSVSPSFVVFSTMALKEQFNGRFRYKRDRKIIINYGTNIEWIPHSVFINDKLARWKTDHEDEDECSYYIDAGANIQIVLTFDMDIRKDLNKYCCLSVTYYGNPILSYEVNELTIKRTISNVYNNRY